MIILDSTTDAAEVKLQKLAAAERKKLQKKHEMVSLEDTLYEDYSYALDLLHDLEMDVDVEIDCDCEETSEVTLKYPEYVAVCPVCGATIYEHYPK